MNNSKALIHEQTIVWFGKWKGFPIDQVVTDEPEYILLLTRTKFFAVSPGLLNMAMERLPYHHYLMQELKKQIA